MIDIISTIGGIPLAAIVACLAYIVFAVLRRFKCLELRIPGLVLRINKPRSEDDGKD